MERSSNAPSFTSALLIATPIGAELAALASKAASLVNEMSLASPDATAGAIWSDNNFAEKIFDDIDIVDIRKSIYDLLLYDISFDEFSLILIEKLGEQQNLNIEQRYKIMESISYYSYVINKGYRSIFHFESLIIFIINVIKNNDIKLIKEVI